MNTNAVYESVRLLPPDSAAHRPTPPVFGRKEKNQPLAAHRRGAEATNERQRAWRIAQGFHLPQEPRPPAISEPPIRRASRDLQGNHDDLMAMAHGLQTALEYGMTRSVLQSLLCARDLSLEGLASLLDWEPDVVKLFEGLGFNVRNRESCAGPVDTPDE